MVNMVGIGGVITCVKSKKVNVTVKDNEGVESEIECIVLHQACGHALEMDNQTLEICGDVLKEKGICKIIGEIDLIIGMTVPDLHKQLSTQKLSNGLVVMETRFGNCFVVQLGSEQRSNYRFGMYHVNKLSISYNDYEQSVLRDHLQAELVGIDGDIKLKTEEEKKFEENLSFSNDDEDN